MFSWLRRLFGKVPDPTHPFAGYTMLRHVNIDTPDDHYEGSFDGKVWYRIDNDGEKTVVPFTWKR